MAHFLAEEEPRDGKEKQIKKAFQGKALRVFASPLDASSFPVTFHDTTAVFST
jgi:hypothetical protein